MSSLVSVPVAVHPYAPPPCGLSHPVSLLGVAPGSGPRTSFLGRPRCGRVLQTGALEPRSEGRVWEAHGASTHG